MRTIFPEQRTEWQRKNGTRGFTATASYNEHYTEYTYDTKTTGSFVSL